MKKGEIMNQSELEKLVQKAYNEGTQHGALNALLGIKDFMLSYMSLNGAEEVPITLTWIDAMIKGAKLMFQEESEKEKLQEMLSSDQVTKI